MNADWKGALCVVGAVIGYIAGMLWVGGGW